VLCNREIKFRAFLDHALAGGAAGIATGHYARITHASDGWHLRRARDESKDQTYFLYQLDQTQLARSRFPLSGLTKSQVRARARAAGLPNHDRKDSTGICFIGERRFRAFLSRFLPARPGPIVTADNRQIGEHQGLMYYTLGQRHGLGLGGLAGGKEAPWFVIAKDLEHDRLIVAQEHDHPQLLSTGLSAARLHWVAGAPPNGDRFECAARIRHRQPLEPCEVQLLPQARCHVELARLQRAITPGQSVVFYLGEDCLGGAIIESAGAPAPGR
jgi:tRNA-specific 2-thiouridylase